MEPNNTIPLSISGENINFIFDEVSDRSEGTVCINGRYFGVRPSGNNSIRIQQIQDKIAKLAFEPTLTMKEFFCNVLSCHESDLSDKNLEAINAIQASILSSPDRKKEFAAFQSRIDSASQNKLYEKHITLLEQKEQILKKLSEESDDLRRDIVVHRETLIDSIQTIAASFKLPQVEAQYKQHRIELLEIKFKLHQLLPASTEQEKHQSAEILSSMMIDAIVTEHVAYANQLIKAGVELEAYHLYGAVIANSSKMIDILVKEGCDPNTRNNNGQSLLWIACLRGQKASQAIEALMKHGASLSALNSNGEAPINEAIISDLEDKKVIALLEKLNKPNFQDGTGSSLLHKAIARISFNQGDAPFNYLLDVQKATPNVKDAKGATLLHHAIERLQDRSLPVVEKLIKKGAITTATDNEGQTALHLAARMSNDITQVGRKDNGAIVRALIKAGAAVNATDLHGRTALHEAVKYGVDASNLRSVEELIKGGIDLDIQDENGNTALHLAAAGEHVDLVKLLLKHGANRNLRDHMGRLPGASGLAVSENRRQRILDLLAKI